MKKNLMRPWGLAVLLGLVAACAAQESVTTPAAEAPAAQVAPAATPVAAPAPKGTPDKMPVDIHWSRNSAEHKAVLLQTYRLAGEIVREDAKTRKPGTWAVVLDADETVIDNSQFQKEQWQKGVGYVYNDWQAWCSRGEAEALPGAIPFLKTVQELGGKVIIVTNRNTEVQEPTERNFREKGIPFDLMLCKPDRSSDKNARYDAVTNGTAAPGMGPLETVMYVGDNIQDYPALKQETMRGADDAAFSDFGDRFILIPNPMYGSWERNQEN